MKAAYTGIPNAAAVAPEKVTADAMFFPEDPDVRFEGFAAEAFDVLERLRSHPHIAQYRKEKTRVQALIQQPFKRYRDDLVVNWLLPNRIGLETEKNVFSRLLKNDFGAGGCHHHLWMSFYRPDRRRLSDVQLAHSLWPEALYISVYLGRPAPQLFKRVHRRILRFPEEFLSLADPMLRSDDTALRINYGKSAPSQILTDPPIRLPDDFEQAKDIALRVAKVRDEVVDLGPRLIETALEAIARLWPLYRYFLRYSTADS